MAAIAGATASEALPQTDKQDDGPPRELDSNVNLGQGLKT